MPAERREGNTVPQTARVFFALWPPEDIARKLATLAEAHAAIAGGRPTRSSTIHLTLAFVGDVAVDCLPALQAAAAAVRTEPFALTLDRLAVWRHNRIVWAGCEVAPALAALVAALRAALQAAGFRVADRGREFTPHITLVRKTAALDCPLPDLEPLSWTCERFALVCSSRDESGSVYRTIAEFPLGKGA